ncbi:NAD(P)-dependent oxidoreductase [Xanthobacter autotrophicus]|uniref:NAD-dependent epimerase/dehydratase family protein n=1 Tax=Xanthobacter autotrophicus TaxID=280 RepID=UPI001E525AE6|nr:NAD(P)-dependent oxidoreductase [Xanthobacter autotrophicus]UDQ88168.1 NAD(P)-dependent oxidoreductase [Xanthobacter autotrophicus]
MNFNRILVTGGSGFIGTNLIEALRARADLVFSNLDIKPPKMHVHRDCWKSTDMRDPDGLIASLQSFRPDALIHLAARTDLDGKQVGDYSSNTDGVARLLEALDATNFAGPVIFTSSMYVCRPGYIPTSDTDFQPHTPYGESKVIGEQLVRDAKPTYPWVITRPTSIWGPWFGIPYADFFKVVLSKRYLHISGDRTQKTYGFVGNTIAQIFAILDHAEELRTKTLYLGDWPPYVISEWADEIAAFVPYRVPRVPKVAFNGLALIGDTLQKVGIRFPMTSFRLSNMTTNNVHDLSSLCELMGEALPFNREQGNALTVKWLNKTS